MTTDLDVLVVGAGPTGLVLAAQLCAYGVRFRLVDRQADRVHESRALAVQPRTLEVLAGLGVSDELVAAGNAAVHLRLHLGATVVPVALSATGVGDTPYPFLLFLSQAETERILAAHLDRHGVRVEREVRLVALDQDGERATCRLRHGDGREETVRARYVAGCDGARSTVREQAGIPFEGAPYPQTFVLGDLEADGLEPGAAHAYPTDSGILFFFPLGQPASWRMLAIRPPGRYGEVTLDELQAIVDSQAADPPRLRDPVWMTDFRLYLRGAARYRSGRVFLAGDAAHIHSPAGGQGMNTGIQDSVNLGWKLGLVLRGQGREALLDTYEAERAPVGHAVLRLTDRLFRLATTGNRAVRTARTRLLPVLAPVVLRSGTVRAAALRTVSQLGIGYRDSPASTEGDRAWRRGPRAGDRLPDGPLVHNGQRTGLHALLRGPGYHLLLTGAVPDAAPLEKRWPGLLTVHRLDGRNATAPRRLGLRRCAPAQYLVRPDGHIGYRSHGPDLAGVVAYLDRWLRRDG
jgi:2-polyprenyl-6-methoxyphenol hydroxylase-like FAD-dependent oxidoreductase